MLPWFKTNPAGHSDNAIIFNGKVLAAMPRTRATVRKEARLALLGSNANALRLPQELLEIVVSLVPRRDLPSVRLACHQLLLSASPRIKHIKVDLNGAHGSLVSTARELQRTLCRLPALNSINLSVAADINTHSVKLPAAFTTPLLQLSAITRLEVDGPRHMYSLALPRKVVLPALKAGESVGPDAATFRCSHMRLNDCCFLLMMHIQLLIKHQTTIIELHLLLCTAGLEPAPVGC